MLGSAISVANVAAGANGFANSTVQKSCQYRTCTIMNSSSLTCDFGMGMANVCMMPSLPPTPRPTAPTGTLPPNFEAAIVAQLRIEGSAFAELLSSNRAGLETAITADLGTLLQISGTGYLHFLHSLLELCHLIVYRRAMLLHLMIGQLGLKTGSGCRVKRCGSPGLCQLQFG